MKNTIKVLWYIIISTIVLAMLVFTTSKVFAHGNGQCITDVAGNVFTGINNDRGYVKIVGHLTPDELDKKDGGKYKHGHIKEYWRDGEKTSESKSYTYVEDEGDFYVDCPTPPQTCYTYTSAAQTCYTCTYNHAYNLYAGCPDTPNLYKQSGNALNHKSFCSIKFVGRKRRNTPNRNPRDNHIQSQHSSTASTKMRGRR